MRVLFVASGNKKGAGQVSSFVQSQYDSLKVEGLDMVLFPIKGKGWKGYLKAVFALRQMVRREKPDIIHAHYSTCGFMASLACLGLLHRPKILVSILGSFPTRDAKWRRVRWAIQYLWDGALTKSERTRNQLGLDLPVIPNGVNLEIFQAKSKEESRKEIGWNIDAARLDSSNLDAAHSGKIKYIIWCSNPERPEKNWGLAKAAIKELENERVSELGKVELVPVYDKTPDEVCTYMNAAIKELENERVSELGKVELVAVYDKTPDEVCTYMNAADCLLLTSNSEGSPNVIKEAMACNCPIVTTDVGDVNERLHDLDGCYVVPDNELESERIRELGNAIVKAIEFGKRTEGRKRIIEDQLEISQIAQRINTVYIELVN